MATNRATIPRGSSRIPTRTRSTRTPNDEDAIDEDATDETTGEDLTDGTTGEDLIEEETTGANGEAGELGEDAELELGEGVEQTETGAGSHKDGVQAGDSQIAQWTLGRRRPFRTCGEDHE